MSNLEHPRRVARYNHTQLERQRNFIRFLLKFIGFGLLAKLGQVEGLENFPMQGPAILMINHIAFLDPVAVMHVAPRNIVPMAKIEVFNYPVWGYFTHLWQVIPVRREEVDRRAIQQALDVLHAGEIILVAPEGTRGSALRQGKVGVAYLASRSGAPIVPVTLQGTNGFPAPRWARSWRGPGAQICFGPSFRYRPELARAGREELRKMTDEAMYILSAMLPEHLRGVYSDLTLASRETLVN